MTSQTAVPAHVSPVLMTIAQVAQYLGVTERHIRRLVSERRIPHVRWGRLIRFDPRKIDKWIEEAAVDARDLPRRYW